MKRIKNRVMAFVLLLFFPGFYALSQSISIANFKTTASLPTTPFFHSELINDHIVRIHGISDEQMYLVEGSKSAVLIDTGAGVGNLQHYVRRITSKPLQVILTHGHVDHIGGAARFQHVYMNHKDDEVFKVHNTMETRHGYVNATYANASELKASDYTPPITLARIKNLSAHDIFNLGGITLEMFDAKGHTPGELAVLMKEDRILLTGDAANQFTFVFDQYSLGLSSYEQSMKALKQETEGKYDRIFVSHGAGEVANTTLTDLIHLCERIKAGNSDDVPFTFMGHKAFIAMKIDKHHHRYDGIDANIVYSKARINE